MELTSCLGNFSKPGSPNCGNNFSFIWIFLILFLCCGDGFGSILDCFCKKKKHHHKKKGCGCNLLGEDNLFILFIVFALFCCNNKGQCC
ncbi:MAG: hypothetical protein LIR50_12260 [Bacillota bacterium]|nr:hypothetical protein [Bacillota bacterium]